MPTISWMRWRSKWNLKSLTIRNLIWLSLSIIFCWREFCFVLYQYFPITLFCQWTFSRHEISRKRDEKVFLHDRHSLLNCDQKYWKKPFHLTVLGHVRVGSKYKEVENHPGKIPYFFISCFQKYQPQDQNKESNKKSMTCLKKNRKLGETLCQLSTSVIFTQNRTTIESPSTV